MDLQIDSRGGLPVTFRWQAVPPLALPATLAAHLDHLGDRPGSGARLETTSQVDRMLRWRVWPAVVYAWKLLLSAVAGISL